MAIIKRSVKISGHATSVTLEPEFWEHLKSLAKAQSLSINQLISEIDQKKTSDNLSSAIRLYILEHYVTKANSE